MSRGEKPRRRRPSLLVPRGLGRIPRHRHVRRHVLQHDRARGEHRVRADAAELVHAGEAAQHRPSRRCARAPRAARCSRTSCGCRRRSRARRACRRGTVAVADRRVAAVLRGAGVDRHVLAEHVVVADRRRRRLAAVLAVLRDLADRRELEDAIARADRRAPGDRRRAGRSSCRRRSRTSGRRSNRRRPRRPSASSAAASTSAVGWMSRHRASGMRRVANRREQLRFAGELAVDASRARETCRCRARCARPRLRASS